MRSATVAVLGGTALLAAAGPRPGDLAAVDPGRPDLLVAAAAGLAAWACVLWLCCGVLLALAGRLPGAAGGAARRIGLVVVPAVLRRAVEAAVGLSVVTGAVTPPAAAQAGLLEYDRPVERPPPPPPVPLPSLDVVVAPGDTLWAIAARVLGDHATDGDVDAEWRRWYAANRAVVGPDPDLIHPGQRLRPPPAT